MVKVVTADRSRIVGVGHFQIGSIAVRMLDFADTEITPDFFRTRLEQALRLRQALGLAREDNDAYRLVQTPQTFKASVLRSAYDQEFDTAFTDDASVVERMGVAITLVDGERTNLKLTTPEDMEWAEWLLQSVR